MEFQPGTVTIKMEEKGKHPEPNMLYTLDTLLNIFKLNRLNQRFADLEMFEKNGCVYLFKKTGQDQFKLHLSHAV